MSNELVQPALHHYAIPAIRQIAPVSAGFLSRNWRVETTEATYFLKQYRFEQEDRVRAAHAAKFFFANTGIPAILPLPHKSGDTILHVDGKYYGLFPFVEGGQYQRDEIPRAALESMAQMQAFIHRAGRAVRLPPVRVRDGSKNYARFLARAEQIRRQIPRENPATFDQLARRTLDLKLRLAAQHRAAIEQIKLTPDHLVHGDYHSDNLFFDAQQQVSHIFDWERTETTARGLHLVRTIAFDCFERADNYMAVYSDENFEKARRYLRAYHDVYPIRRSEFARACRVWYLQMMISLWVERTHYLDGSERVDVFLQSEHGMLQYYAAHFEEYVERIAEVLD